MLLEDINVQVSDEHQTYKSRRQHIQGDLEQKKLIMLSQIVDARRKNILE